MVEEGDQIDTLIHTFDRPNKKVFGEYFNKQFFMEFINTKCVNIANAAPK